MSNACHSVVRSTVLPLLGGLVVAISLTGCGGQQSADSADNADVAENVKKIGSVETTESTPAATPAPSAEPASAPAAAPEKSAAAPAEKPAEAAPATQASAAPAEAAAAPAASGGAPDGEAVYKKACFACHMAGVANAPKAGDKAAWAPRVAKGMDALLQSALKGVPGTAMPPKGNCGACSEEELKAAIKFMSGQ